jgi:phospholipid/cholesterol/gamma-HCH transport system substrate-binding protein
MSEKPNYFKIGLFVILGTLVLAVAIIIFGGGKFFEKKYVLETYFDQSVEGLSVGSPLKFQGVKIGNVTELGFVFNEYKTDYHYVLVRAQTYPERRITQNKNFTYLDEEQRKKNLEEMIKKGLRLQLASQGVTGLAFLNAVYLDGERYPALTIDWKPEYIYIPSAPGTITLITQTIEKLTETIQSINFKEISDNVEELVVTLNTTVKEAKIEKVSEDLQKLLKTLNNTTSELDKILKSKDVKTTITNISETTGELRKTLVRANRLIQNREHNVKITLDNLERISEDLREFMTTVKNYPSWVLFGNPPPRFIEELEGEKEEKSQ